MLLICPTRCVADPPAVHRRAHRGAGGRNPRDRRGGRSLLPLSASAPPPPTLCRRRQHRRQHRLALPPALLSPAPPALRDRDGCAPQVWGCGNYWVRPMIAADSQGHYPLHQCAPPPQTQINTASLALCTTWCADLGFRVTTETRSSTAAGCPSRPSATCSRPGCRWCPSTPTAAPSGWCRGATRW